MKELKDYTDDELRDELKRRAIERRKNTPREIVYVEFQATIVRVDNTLGYKCGGEIKYKPFVFWKYRLTDCSYELANAQQWNDYYLKQGSFKRDNAPQIGDRVRVRYRRTKKQKECFDLIKAKIVEIIK